MSEDEREMMFAVSYTDAADRVWVLVSSDGPVVFGNVTHRDVFGAEFMIESTTSTGDLRIRMVDDGWLTVARPWVLVGHWTWIPHQES